MATLCIMYRTETKGSATAEAKPVSSDSIRSAAVSA
jgi:hypothetical protein